MDISAASNLSDETLLAGLGSGDPEAAAHFVRRFQRRVFGLTFSILRDEGAAEEAAQEAFTRAWRHASACGAGAAWGQRLPVDLSLVHEIRFQAPDGRTALTATFDAANPWQ